MTTHKMVPLPGFEDADPCGIRYNSSLHKNERRAQEMRLKRRSDPDFNAKELERLREWQKAHKRQRRKKKRKEHIKREDIRVTWEVFSDAHPLDGQRRVHCAYCGDFAPLIWVVMSPDGPGFYDDASQGKFFEIDHVIPYCSGGKGVIGNIAPACTKCNGDKHDKDLREWLQDECLYEATLMSIGDAEWLCNSTL